jgi:hypothetical protein
MIFLCNELGVLCRLSHERESWEDDKVNHQGKSTTEEERKYNPDAIGISHRLRYPHVAKRGSRSLATNNQLIFLKNS